MLDSLLIKNFRCFDELKIDSLGRVNLIVGKNNVGKSSLLEGLAFFAASQSITSKESALKVLEDQVTMLDRRRESFPENIGLASKITAFYKEKKANSFLIGDLSSSSFSQFEFKFFHEEDVEPNGILGAELNINSKIYNFLIDREFNFKLNNYKKDLLLSISLEPKGYSFLETSSSNFKYLASIWDQVKFAKRSSIAIDLLKVVDNRIDDLFFTSNNEIMVSFEGMNHALSIKQLGDGMSKILELFLHTFQSKNGYLLIDEFENGLHYSIQEEIWDKLFKLAKELDIQVFATTHSQDAVKSFSKVALASPEEGRLIALSRSNIPQQQGKIVAVSYDEKEIAVISKTGMEVR